MDDLMQQLVDGIRKWRNHNVDDYWVRVSYLGGELNRFGDHELTLVNGKLYHHWQDSWREIKTGSDFWLFSVPGTFAWARDMMTKVAPGTDVGLDAVDLVIDEEYGYVQRLQFEVGQRDTQNFTFEVKRFSAEPHPNFEQPS
jgi:hypothetical protein